jgi:hypothetical protein
VINKTLAFADAIALIATLIYFLPKSTRRDPRNLTTAGVDESVNGKQLFPKQEAMPERELTYSRNGTNCNILRFDLWNADTDIVNTTNFLNGSSICADAFALSFEAVTDSCVSSVRFRLIGSEGTNYSNTERVAGCNLCTVISVLSSHCRYLPSSWEDPLAFPKQNSSDQQSCHRSTTSRRHDWPPGRPDSFRPRGPARH